MSRIWTVWSVSRLHIWNRKFFQHSSSPRRSFMLKRKKDSKATVTIKCLVRTEHPADFFFPLSLVLNKRTLGWTPDVGHDRVSLSHRLKTSRSRSGRVKRNLEWTHLPPQRWVFTPLLLVNRMLRGMRRGDIISSEITLWGRLALRTLAVRRRASCG